MYKNQKGDLYLVGMFAAFLFFSGLIFAMFFVRFKLSNETVSGIVYNTTNNRFISNATCFSVRADVDTYVSEENRSSYCLPPNSEHIELVNRAAADKRIKVRVDAKKYFVVKLPWTVVPNVTVAEIK